MAAEDGRDPQYLLDLLWRTRAAGTRGPRGSLSVDQVVGEAVRIADAEGVGAVSMRRIAQALGVTTMTLYRYVPSKDDLLDLMFHMGSGPPDTTDWPADWRGALRCWGRQMREMVVGRPWMLDIPIGAPPFGPNNLAWMEAALAAMDETPLNEGDMMEVLMILTSFVLGSTRQEVSMTRASERTGVSYEEWGRAYGRMLPKIMGDGRYPTLAKVTATGVFENENSPADDFDQSLEFLLNSVAALIRRREDEAGGEAAD
ncbi:TetR/AcrR family transcriptional regulator [Streptomyces sp. DSM 44915]|uniref:TetR/AcrR family transcriptional regulator n=1 Tax=Streptomyces chisholmiae TaxID=3075540 RepID=A0ABU2K0A5_9ACTN|nr:TetR/AcrR family transcriptional regulator [Streptomyces sp. DSM 44915]MDT0270414.1 TetR/AcrR family transcriptional regulator [Streptomyces sp. DSM 44915]